MLTKVKEKDVKFDRIKWHNHKNESTQYTSFVKELVTCCVDRSKSVYYGQVCWKGRKIEVGPVDKLETAQEKCVEKYVEWINGDAEQIIRLKLEDLEWQYFNGAIVANVLGFFELAVKISTGEVKCEIRGYSKVFWISKVFYYVLDTNCNEVVAEAKKHALNKLKSLLIANREFVRKSRIESGISKIVGTSDLIGVGKHGTSHMDATTTLIENDATVSSICIADLRDGQHYEMVFDTSDLSKMREYKWYVKRHSSGKLVACAYDKEIKKHVYAHRVIMDVANGSKLIVGHKDGNGLNNAKANLKFKSAMVKHDNLELEFDKHNNDETEVTSSYSDDGWNNKLNRLERKLESTQPKSSKEVKIEVGVVPLMILKDAESGEYIGAMIDGKFISLDDLRNKI